MTRTIYNLRPQYCTPRLVRFVVFSGLNVHPSIGIQKHKLLLRHLQALRNCTVKWWPVLSKSRWLRISSRTSPIYVATFLLAQGICMYNSAMDAVSKYFERRTRTPIPTASRVDSVFVYMNPWIVLNTYEYTKPRLNYISMYYFVASSIQNVSKNRTNKHISRDRCLVPLSIVP